jgi:hypothetical protein
MAGPKKGPTGEAFPAGLPNAHGVLPQVQNFSYYLLLLKISPFLLHLNGDIPSRGPGNPRRLTRHGNADFRAGVLVSSALCGSLAFSALFISTLGEFGLGELTTLESLTTRTQISRSLARSEVEVLTRLAPRDSSEARGSVATRGGVAPGAKKQR